MGRGSWALWCGDCGAFRARGEGAPWEAPARAAEAPRLRALLERAERVARAVVQAAVPAAGILEGIAYLHAPAKGGAPPEEPAPAPAAGSLRWCAAWRWRRARVGSSHCSAKCESDAFSAIASVGPSPSSGERCQSCGRPLAFPCAVPSYCRTCAGTAPTDEAHGGPPPLRPRLKVPPDVARAMAHEFFYDPTKPGTPAEQAERRWGPPEVARVHRHHAEHARGLEGDGGGMSHHPECKHPGPHDELCSCALLEMRDLRTENGRLRKEREAARTLLERWRARGFPMGGSELWDDTIAFLDDR